MIVIFTRLFGIVVGYFVLRFFFRQKIITREQLTKIVSVYFVIQLGSLFFFKNFLLVWLLVFAPILIVALTLFFYYQHLESQFQSEFPDILTNLILQMKLGKSFRKSFQESVACVSKRYEPILFFLFENVVFSPQLSDKKLTETGGFFAEVIDEFKKIDQTSHQSIERLEKFRRRLISLNEFRRKSGRIRGQVHLQATLMSLIYLASFAGVASMFALKEHLTLLFCSASLFLSGLLGLFLIGRRFRWKI